MSSSHIISLPLIFQTISLAISCDIENEVVNNYPLSNLDTWTECYNKPYNSAMGTTTKASSLPNCETGDNYLIFVAALQSSSSNEAYVGAYGPSSVLTTNTDSTSIAYKPSMIGYPDYNVYWYNNIDLNPGSFGFAPNSTIDLSIGDDFNPNDEQRLSWRLEGYGGRRAGSNTYLDWSSTWYKVVYYKYCEIPDTTNFPLISTTTAAATTGCDLDIENEVVNNYAISNLNGWTECYNKPYNSAMGTTISSLPNCETDDDILIFVGAKSSSSSDYAYVGAFGPSSVLTTNTDSTSMAYKPSMNDYPDYDVYWYNNIDLNPGSFGFAPNATISLSIGDDFNPNDEQRLSWRLEGYGGRRAGSNLYLDWSSTWYKIVYYKQCGNSSTEDITTTTTDTPKALPSTTTSIDVTNTGCDRLEYTYSYGGDTNYLNIIPAGVCLRSIIGSEMYVCDGPSTMRELSWYYSDECEGEISYSQSVAESLEFYDNVSISITCCTGNQCPYVDVVVYDFDDISDCTNSDDLDIKDGDVNLFSSEGPYVISSCEYINYGWWNYSTSYECLDGKFIEYEYEDTLECKGAIDDTEEISNGDCYAYTSTTKIQISEVICGTAMDTCGMYGSSATVPAPVVILYIIYGIIIGLVMFV